MNLGTSYHVFLCIQLVFVPFFRVEIELNGACSCFLPDTSLFFSTGALIHRDFPVL